MTVNYNPGISTSGLVIYFDASNPRCYPGSGSTIRDLSQNNNNGTLYNTPTYSNGALTFNGTSSYIGVSDSPSLNPGSSNWSVVMWFNPASVSGTYGGPILYNKEVLYEAAHGGDSVEIAWQPSWAWYGSQTISVGNWYQTVHVYNGSTQTMYLNGTSTWSQAMSGNMGSNSYDLGIGARGLSGGGGAGASAFGNFTFSLFSMYNVALTQDQINQNFSAFRGRYNI